MRKFWDRKQDAVERALRSERPIARDELVSALVERTAAARPERRWFDSDGRLRRGIGRAGLEP